MYISLYIKQMPTPDTQGLKVHQQKQFISSTFPLLGEFIESKKCVSRVGRGKTAGRWLEASHLKELLLGLCPLVSLMIIKTWDCWPFAAVRLWLKHHWCLLLLCFSLRGKGIFLSLAYQVMHSIEDFCSNMKCVTTCTKNPGGFSCPLFCTMQPCCAWDQVMHQRSLTRRNGCVFWAGMQAGGGTQSVMGRCWVGWRYWESFGDCLDPCCGSMGWRNRTTEL